MAWRAPVGPIDTDITFEPLPAGGTRITFTEEMHDSLPATAAAATGLAGRVAKKDLQSYKELLEGAGS